MAGLSLSISYDGLDQAIAKLERLGSTVRGQEFILTLAREGANQTQRRIQSEKTGPDGAAWAKTRDGRAALFATGEHLNDSIQAEVIGPMTAAWGSGWIGARVHQFGATIKPVHGRALVFMAGGKKVFAKKVTIPARPFLGMSAANEADMQGVAARAIAMVLQ